MTYATTLTDDWTLDRALALSRLEQLALFATLPAAELSEMDGEYFGHAEKPQDSKAETKQNDALFDERSPFGFWLGKAFKLTSPVGGEGYNHCRKSERTVRHLRFGTHIGASYVDGKAAFLITYASFNNRSGAVDLTDEVRRLTSGLYLCAATVRMPNGERSRPTVFLLSGPIGPWIGPDDPNRESLRANTSLTGRLLRARVESPRGRSQRGSEDRLLVTNSLADDNTPAES